jgi:hypothetical protein
MMVDEGGSPRLLKSIALQVDIVVTGGGLAGVCASIAAARAGSKVVLVQDRPVLGGNASSEVRLWILGATSHMGNNNRWAREGGIVDELLVENLYRNKEGNPLIFDTILLEKVMAEKNIMLLLNTSVYEADVKAQGMINTVNAFCSQNQTRYILSAEQFIDASGDGILSFLSGAAFRMGAESKDEFGELFAPTSAYGELLGHSIYFYTKDVGFPIKYTAPAFALKDITSIPRYRSFNSKDQGCKLWWIEYGGRLDTVHDTEKIKWELWKIVYGVWDHIKNSGEFPDAANLTLEWVGTIPGKRESRRFEGDYILRQQDIIEQRNFEDQIAFGGWSIDLHPADGVFSELPGCNQWHSKGIYSIPYRCVYSRNINNLFLAGRIISASHVAFGSSRVMATGAAIGQAVGTAATICIEQALQPRELGQKGYIEKLQQNLLSSGVFLPGLTNQSTSDLVQVAEIRSSSYYQFNGFRQNGEWMQLQSSFAQMIPCQAGPVPGFSFQLKVLQQTTVTIQLRVSEKKSNYTPEKILAEKSLALSEGIQDIYFDAGQFLSEDQYVYMVILKNDAVSIPLTDFRVTGILSLFNHVNPAVSNYGKQTPTANIGVDAFEFWCPQRRPGGKNLAFGMTHGNELFSLSNIRNGIDRPYVVPNAWVADPDDGAPRIFMKWKDQQLIKSIEICFDNDFDHPMESVLMGHPENEMPFCVKELTIFDDKNQSIAELRQNHESRCLIQLEHPVKTNALTINLKHPHASVPAALFAIRCFKS